MISTSRLFSFLLMAFSCSSCAYGIHDNLENTCGAEKYSKEIQNTKERILNSHPPKYPASPAFIDETSGCVGIAFRLNKDGSAENVQIIESTSRRFNRPALDSFKKYVFSKSDATLMNAYLIVDFSLD